MAHSSDRYAFYIARLLSKKLEGIITPAENEELERWRAMSQANNDLYELWNDRQRISAMLGRYAGIDSARAEKEGRRRIGDSGKRPLRRALRIGAAAACVAVAVTVSLLVTGNRQEDRIADALATADGYPVPVLILEDGTKIPIDDMPSGVHALPENVGKPGAASLVYNAEEAAADENISLHTLQVPRGRQLDVVLPDGTQVWLNADSRIHFPTRFEDGDRTVHLEGEAYFSVTKQAGRPFNVSLPQGTITARGTEFNVTGYERSAVSATLVSGAIDFKSESGRTVSLKPGQRAKYDRGSDGIEVEDVNVKPHIAWRDNIFHFDGHTLAEIARELERWYDVRFEFAQPLLRELRLSVHVGREETLETLLGLFEKGSHARFAIRDEVVTVTTS